jgi:hypothetical protein
LFKLNNKWIFQIKTFPYGSRSFGFKETFDLYHDTNLDMLITSPQPSLNNLGRYYESEDYIHIQIMSLFEKAYHFVKGIALKTN